MPQSRALSYLDVPVAYSLEYADADARLAASGLTAADRGRIARQVDSGDFYILQNHSPLIWALVGVPPTVNSYLHTQASAATTWVINHNLGFNPSIEIRNAGGVVVAGRVTHTTLNQTQVQFNVAITGTARAN